MTDSITYYNGAWQEGAVPIINSTDHAAWLASVVFDGARAFRGMAPDLDLHCARLIASAHAMGLDPVLTAEEIEELAWEGIGKFPPDAELYVRPMLFATEGFVVPDPNSARFALVVSRAPLPEAAGFTACLSSYRRPAANSAPTDAKASCLYPNAARMLKEAQAKGFDNAVVLDQKGDVAEFATANLFIVKDGVAHTPQVNGTFLNGITRQRVIKLLSAEGIEVRERKLSFEDVMDADEVFSSGNYAKVWATTRVEDRHLQPGPVAQKAKDLYFAFARSATR